MFFRIEGTDVYMFGGIHFGKPSFYPLPDPVEAAFRSSKQIWFEANFDPNVSKKRSQCPLFRTLGDYVSTGTLNKLREIAPRAGLSIDNLLFMKPWAATFAFIHPLWKSEGCVAEFGLESYFARLATVGQKSTSYLETTDDQLSLFDSAPREQQEEFLARGLFNPKEAQDETHDLLIGWCQSSMATFDSIVERAISRHPFMEKVIFGRNRAWLPKLRTLVEFRVPAFVCVGVLHFAGRESLTALLREKYGYNLVQVPLGRNLC